MSETINSATLAKQFGPDRIDASSVSNAEARGVKSRVVQDAANQTVGMANLVGDREFTGALNSIKKLVISDQDGPIQSAGQPNALASSVFSTNTITFFNQYFEKNVNYIRNFIHEVFHQTPTLDAARISNPNGIHGKARGFEEQTNTATDFFVSKYYDLQDASP